MKRDFDAVTLLQLLHHRFDVQLAGTRKQKLFRLCIATEMKRRIFFENLVQRRTDLLFVLSRLRLDREGDRSFGILDRVVNNLRLLVAKRIAGLRLF